MGSIVAVATVGACNLDPIAYPIIIGIFTAAGCGRGEGARYNNARYQRQQDARQGAAPPPADMEHAGQGIAPLPPVMGHVEPVVPPPPELRRDGNDNAIVIELPQFPVPYLAPQINNPVYEQPPIQGMGPVGYAAAPPPGSAPDGDYRVIGVYPAPFVLPVVSNPEDV